MSTKIYEGLKFKTGDLRTIYAELDDLRDTFDAWAYDDLLKRLLSDAAFMHDRFRLGLRLILSDYDRPKSPWAIAFGQYLDRHRTQDRMLRSNDNGILYSAQVTIHPISRRTVLCLPFASHRELLHMISTHPMMCEYRYWNNTDRPDDIDAREWNQRGRNWDKALQGGRARCSIPAMSGMTVQLLREDVMIFSAEKHDLDGAMPSFDQRVDRVVQSRTPEFFAGKVSTIGENWFGKYLSLQKTDEYKRFCDDVERQTRLGLIPYQRLTFDQMQESQVPTAIVEIRK